MIEILKTSLKPGKNHLQDNHLNYLSDRDVRSLVEEDRENAGIADEPIKEFSPIDENAGFDEYDYLRNREVDTSKKTSEKFKQAWRDIEKLGINKKYSSGN